MLWSGLDQKTVIFCPMRVRLCVRVHLLVCLWVCVHASVVFLKQCSVKGNFVYPNNTSLLRLFMVGCVLCYCGNDSPFTIESVTQYLKLFFSTERNRETIDELTAALKDEQSRAEHVQLALTNEKRQTEALRHSKERADQLRNTNKGRT